MNRNLIILVVLVVAVVAIVAFVVVPIFIGAFNPPVDVYVRPTPSPSESPLDLLPGQAAGFDRESVTEGTNPAISVEGFYGGGITIGIARFSSSDDAADFLGALSEVWGDRSGSMTSQRIGEVHWFTFTGGGESVFVWRKGVWLFLVIAPEEALRNQVVEELPF